MTFWAIRDKKTGLFFDGVERPLTQTPVRKIYSTESHAKSALTQAVQATTGYYRLVNADYSGLEVVKMKAEVDE